MDINSIRTATPTHEPVLLTSTGSGARIMTQLELVSLKQSQCDVHKHNLIDVCRMCIKSLVDASAFQSIMDDNAHLNNFCVIVEYLFLFRLLPHKKNSWFGPEEPFSPWSVVSSFKKQGSASRIFKLETQSIQTIEEMCVGSPPITKFRAWLRLALLEKRFAEYFNTLSSSSSLISHFYDSGSCFHGEDGQILSENFKCLNSIDFQLCLKDFTCPGEFSLVINFSPYLLYTQTAESQAADEMERLRFANPGLLDEDNLVEMLRKEREQKLFYEEVIRSKEEEIQSLQDQNSELSADRSDKQLIILELQRLLEQTQNALRESQNNQEKKPWIANISNLAFIRGGSDHAQNNSDNRDDPNSDFVSFGAYTSGKVPQDPDLWSRPLEENAIRKKPDKVSPKSEPRPPTEPLTPILPQPPVSPLVPMPNEDPIPSDDPRPLLEPLTEPTETAVGHINLDYTQHNGDSHD